MKCFQSTGIENLGSVMARHKSGGVNTVKETSKALKISVPTIYRLISKGKIRASKIGGSTRITDEEIERLRQGEAA
jgi:excisionase family DNA binding protein